MEITNRPGGARGPGRNGIYRPLPIVNTEVDVPPCTTPHAGRLPAVGQWRIPAAAPGRQANLGYTAAVPEGIAIAKSPAPPRRWSVTPALAVTLIEVVIGAYGRHVIQIELPCDLICAPEDGLLAPGSAPSARQRLRRLKWFAGVDGAVALHR